jgi:hypothetical protein
MTFSIKASSVHSLGIGSGLHIDAQPFNLVIDLGRFVGQMSAAELTQAPRSGHLPRPAGCPQTAHVFVFAVIALPSASPAAPQRRRRFQR